MSSIFQLFYVSRATRPFDNATIQDVLQAARRNNRRLDLTGCLLYSGQCFGQVLEGSEAAVLGLVARIGRDPRHCDVRILMESHRPEREYGDWSMGYLHDQGLQDDLEKLLTGQAPPATRVADVMSRMKPDTVMGALP